MKRTYQIKNLNVALLKQGYIVLKAHFTDVMLDEKMKRVTIEVSNITKNEALDLVANIFKQIKNNATVIEEDFFSKINFILIGDLSNFAYDEFIHSLNLSHNIDYAFFDKEKKIVSVSYQNGEDVKKIIEQILPKRIRIKEDKYIKESSFYLSSCNADILKILIESEQIIDAKYGEHHLYVKYKDCVNIFDYIKEILDKHDSSIRLYNYVNNDDISDDSEHLGIIRHLVAISLLIFGSYNFDSLIGFCVVIVAFLIAGYDVIIKAVTNFLSGILFDSNFMVSLACLGAIFMNYQIEGTIVMLVYQVGIITNKLAVLYSKKSLTRVNQKIPSLATLENGKCVYVESIMKNDVVVVKPNEIIPLDGVIVYGSSSVDNSLFSHKKGTSFVNPEDTVLAGSKNISSVIHVKTTALYDETKIYHLYNNIYEASKRKTKMETMIEKFNSFYSPFVLIVALGIFIVPFLFLHENYEQWINLSLIFLLVSLPLTVSIYIPTSYLIALVISSRMGIRISGSDVMESLGHVKSICLSHNDLLSDEYLLESVCPLTLTKEEIYKYALPLALHYKHMAARALLASTDIVIDASVVKNMFEANSAVYGDVKEGKICLVSANIATKMDSTLESGDILYLMLNEKCAGYFKFKRLYFPSISTFVDDAKNIGIEQVIVFSQTDEVSKLKEFGFEDIYTNVDELEREKIINKIYDDKKNPLVIDSSNINLINHSYLNCSLSGIEKNISDIAIMDSDPKKIIDLLKISYKLKQINFRSIFLEIVMKIVLVTLALLGSLTIVGVIVTDFIVSLLCSIGSIFIMNRFSRNYK